MWTTIDLEVEDAIKAGWLIDYRPFLPTHATKRFRRRVSPSDILGACTHQSGSNNQIPEKTAAYHVSANHVSGTGCPGLLYGFAISTQVHPDKVLLCNDLQSITWSQGKGDDGSHPEYSGDENRHLVSVLVMGDFDEIGRGRGRGDPSRSQLMRWDLLMSWLESTFRFDHNGLFGHYHFGKAACPGRTLREQIEARRAIVHRGLDTDADWQKALLAWDPTCLPRYGADGVWGEESRRALIRFERSNQHRIDGFRDPFTELLLLRRNPRI